MSRTLASYNPFRCQGTEMLPHFLLVCKLSILVVFIKEYYLELEAPFIPFIGLLDLFHGSEAYTFTLRAGLFVGGGLVLFNKWPKFGATLAGSVLLIHLLGTRLDFKNHVMLTACVLLICGLAPNKYAILLYRLQLGLIYFGATLNKILDPDWRNGLFFQNWMEARLKFPILADIAHATHPTLVYAAAGWITIIVEATMLVLILSPQYNRAAIWLGAIFHFSTTVFAGGSIFGFFVPCLLIAFLGLNEQNKTTAPSQDKVSSFTQRQQRLKESISTPWILFTLFWLIHFFSPHLYIVQTLIFSACFAVLFPYADTWNWFRSKILSHHGSPVR